MGLLSSPHSGGTAAVLQCPCHRGAAYVSASGKAAFSLAEIMIAMAILGIMATAFMASSAYARKVAQSAIVSNTALTVATGYIEQIKTIEYEELAACVLDNTLPIPTMINQGTDDPLYIGKYVSKTIPIRTDDNDVVLQTMTLEVMVEINNTYASTGEKLLEIAVHYRWNEPGSTRQRNACIRSARSYVPTF